MNQLKRLTACLLVGLLWIGAVGRVSAQAADQRGITIIPPRFELFGNPGDTITEQIRVRNDSASPITYKVLVEDFSSTGEEGQVVLEEGQSDAKYSLASWITPEVTDLTLEPGQEKPFGFTIVIPKEAEPGGHYASILFQTGGDTQPGMTAVSQRVGALALLRISGNVTEDATIETFEAPQYSKTGPINLSLRLKNNGNTHIRPKGTIVITDIFGKKVDELPLNGLNVLPGATRKMDTEWNRSNLLGYYTATLVATYGQQNLPLTAATRFAVASPLAVGLIIGGLIALILLIISLFTGRKRLGKAMGVMVSGK